MPENQAEEIVASVKACRLPDEHSPAQTWPAMIAAITNLDGKITGAHARSPPSRHSIRLINCRFRWQMGLTAYPQWLYGNEITPDVRSSHMVRWVIGTAAPTAAVDINTSSIHWFYGANLVRFFVAKDATFDAGAIVAFRSA
ncbi:hypothetical protein [Bradyrhizobium sp. RDI18]|uniref:hypothetical protein n=1 Tax=Bradyrhizobium sp. RDI18 TaxID=3367400 RepID=UPI00371F86FC